MALVLLAKNMTQFSLPSDPNLRIPLGLYCPMSWDHFKQGEIGKKIGGEEQASLRLSSRTQPRLDQDDSCRTANCETTATGAHICGAAPEMRDTILYCRDSFLFS